MSEYRKKPVVIEARQLSPDNHQELANWIAGSGYEVRHASRPPMRAVTGLVIKTLEGDMTADYGDWIIRGVAGEFYPCKPDIFEVTYDAVASVGDTDPAPAAAAEHSWFSQAALDVTAERRRQIEAEGWGPEHDDKEHSNGELAIAAACYAISGGTDDGNRHLLGFPSRWQYYGGNLIVGAVYVLWSLTIKWSSEWWKPTTRRRDLVKAGAFIIAEIDRLDRAEAKP